MVKDKFLSSVKEKKGDILMESPPSCFRADQELEKKNHDEIPPNQRQATPEPKTGFKNIQVSCIPCSWDLEGQEEKEILTLPQDRKSKALS